jgi:lysophospholipase L1-like esterase
MKQHKKTYRVAHLFITLLLLLVVTSAGNKKLIRIACIGDSITFGAGVEKREKNAYPYVLGAMLGEDYDVRNYGHSGATMVTNGNLPYTELQVYKDAQTFMPDIVIIKLGTNDSKHYNWNKEKYISDYKNLVNTFKKLKSKPKIWVCLPVPVYETRWDIRAEIVDNEVIPAIKEVAKELNLPIIDLYAPLSNKPELFPDKIHPNADGAKIIATTVYEVLAKYFKIAK